MAEARVKRSLRLSGSRVPSRKSPKERVLGLEQGRIKSSEFGLGLLKSAGSFIPDGQPLRALQSEFAAALF